MLKIAISILFCGTGNDPPFAHNSLSTLTRSCCLLRNPYIHMLISHKIGIVFMGAQHGGDHAEPQLCPRVNLTKCAAAS